MEVPRNISMFESRLDRSPAPLISAKRVTHESGRRLQLDARSAHEADDFRAVRIQRIRNVFDELEAIRDISLDVAKGEFVSLLGPSGCTQELTVIGSSPGRAGFPTRS